MKTEIKNQYISFIKDNIGSNYIGIKISNSIVSPYLSDLERLFYEDHDKYVKYTSNQQLRDNIDKTDMGYHITIFSVMEMNKLYKISKSFDNLFKNPVNDIELMGIGTAKRHENETFYIVVKSETLQSVRRSFGLEEKDFHITIGFDKKDVFGVRKNEVIYIPSKIENVMGKKIGKYETYAWFSEVRNMPEELINSYKRPKLIEIKNDIAHFEVGEYRIGISLIDLNDNLGENLYVVYRDLINKSEVK